MRKDRGEHNFICGDYLTCQGCGEMIYLIPYIPQIIYYKQIKLKYIIHFRNCAKMRALVKEPERW